MRNHVLGLTLFSFIVGATAFVYAMFFGVMPITPVIETEDVSASPAVKTSCWKMKRESEIDSLKINQAVYNLQSKEFSWDIATPRSDEMLALHFFSKDESGTHYIKTETINARMAQRGVLRFNNTYQWLNKLKSLDNLYVVAEFYSDIARHPQFDAAHATAVTFNHGELAYPIVGNVEVR